MLLTPERQVTTFIAYPFITYHKWHLYKLAVYKPTHPY